MVVRQVAQINESIKKYIVSGKLALPAISKNHRKLEGIYDKLLNEPDKSHNTSLSNS
jgi:hypothetical protein